MQAHNDTEGSGDSDDDGGLAELEGQIGRQLNTDKTEGFDEQIEKFSAPDKEIFEMSEKDY